MKGTYIQMGGKTDRQTAVWTERWTDRWNTCELTERQMDGRLDSQMA